MKLTSKRQVTIPAELCRAKGWVPHDEVEWAEHKDGLLFRKAERHRAGREIVRQMLEGGRIAGTTEDKLRFTRGDE